MPFWIRPLITFAAVAAIIFANCYAPQLAHAMARTAAPAGLQVTMDSSVLPCHEHGAPDHGKSTDQSNPYCCAAACAASAFIFASPALELPPVAQWPLAALADTMRAASWEATEPPPRA